MYMSFLLRVQFYNRVSTYEWLISDTKHHYKALPTMNKTRYFLLFLLDKANLYTLNNLPDSCIRNHFSVPIMKYTYFFVNIIDQCKYDVPIQAPDCLMRHIICKLHSHTESYSIPQHLNYI